MVRLIYGALAPEQCNGVTRCNHFQNFKSSCAGSNLQRIDADVRQARPKGGTTASIDDLTELKMSQLGIGVMLHALGGQSCCENRYMSTDDDVQLLVGNKIIRIEARAGPDIDKEYDCHEQVFVEIGTDKGFVTIVNHNEHNGYYGSFSLTITEV